MRTTLSLVALFALLWAFSDRFPFRNEVTVYHLFCTEGRKEGKCTSKEETANPTTYRVFVVEQTIVYWTGDNTAPNRLRHCAIRDTENWSCQLGDKLEESPKYQWQMVNGEFRDVVEPPGVVTDIFYQAPKWRWWWIWLLEKVK